MKVTPDKSQKFSRKIQVRAQSTNDEAQTVRASLSSAEPVERVFGTEILVHTEDAIDFSRAEDGLPLLDEHETLVGRIEDVALESDGKTRGTLKFSPNTARGREVFAEVRDGFLKDMSIGYRILDWEDRGDDKVFITRWQPLEASVVAVPADATVGLNRRLEAAQMPDEKTGGSEAAVTQKPDDVNIADFKAARKRNLDEGKKLGAEEERQRQAAIRQLFAGYLHRGQEYLDLMGVCLDQKVSELQATRMILELTDDETPSITTFEQRGQSMQEHNAPTFSRTRPTEPVKAGKDEYEKFVEGIAETLDVRSGLADEETRKSNASSEFRGLTLAEMARMFCEKRNVSLSGLSRDQMVGRSFTMERALTMGARNSMINATGSDFANLLSNTANKALQVGYSEAEESWNQWCSIGSTSDFKIFDRPNLSGFSDLDEVGEASEYQYGKFVDEKESARVVTYGKLFSISRQAIVNDDLSAMTAAPRAMGRAAARKVGDQVYAILTGNPNMADGNPLFDDANHSNLNTTPTAPTVQSIDDIRVAMQLQTDPNNITVGISPAYLLCPLQLLGTCLVLSRDQYDPAGTAGTLTSNIVQNTFMPIGERRLSQDSAADWYMAAAPNSFSTIEVTFLDGVQTPFLDEQDGWNVDGAEYKVRLDCVAKALNWRGMYKQTGA